MTTRNDDSENVQLLPLMTAKEVGALLNVPAKTVLRLSRRGDIPRVRIGAKTVRFDLADVREYLQRARAAGTTRNY